MLQTISCKCNIFLTTHSIYDNVIVCPYTHRFRAFEATSFTKRLPERVLFFNKPENTRFSLPGWTCTSSRLHANREAVQAQIESLIHNSTWRQNVTYTCTNSNTTYDHCRIYLFRDHRRSDYPNRRIIALETQAQKTDDRPRLNKSDRKRS